MKKILLIAVVFLSLNIPAFAQVENIAQDVLDAYKNRDVELLKKHASAMFKVSISESYFKDEAIQEDLKAVDDSDGKIKGIRYEGTSMMGANVVMATAYFFDIPGKDELYAVTLSNFNNTGWAIFGNGLSKMTKEEFNQMSKTIPAFGVVHQVRPQKAEKKFNIEMADGDTFDNVSKERFVELFSKLDEDNFYIILNNGSNYLQASYSAKGYTFEYQDEEGHFTARELLSKDEAISLFQKYYQDQKGWKEDVVWDKD